MFFISYVCPVSAHLVLLCPPLCWGPLLTAPAGVSLLSVGGHLLGRPLPQNLVQVEAAPVAHEERTHLRREGEGNEGKLFKDTEEEVKGQWTNERRDTGD